MLNDPTYSRSTSRSGTLVFHHNGIGDYVMSLPVLRMLSRVAPEPMWLIAGDSPAAFLYDELVVDQRLHVPVRPGRFAHVFDPDDIQLTHRFEFFVSLVTWDAPEICTLMHRSGARTSVGLFSQFSVQLDIGAVHDLHRLFALGLPFSPNARLDDFSSACRFPTHTPSLREALVPASGRLLVVHPDTRKEKMWPVERYDPLLRAFLDDEPDWHVAVLNLSPEQLPLSIGTDRAHVIEGVDLAACMRLVAEADFFLGIDSCMLHVADLSRVPGVALFGPTDARQFGYALGPNVYAHNLEAREGLRELDVDRVLDSVQRGVAQVECRN